MQYTLRDTAGKRESVEYFIVGSAIEADLLAEVAALSPLLDLVTGSAIESASYRKNLTLPGGLKANPSATYLNTRGALLGFDVTGSKYRWSNRIPAILQTFVTGDDVIVDPASALDDLVQYILTGNTAAYVNRYNEELIALLGASLSLHKKQQ
jgi:hypothetical protein